MASVRVVCDSNFTKTGDVDKSVAKVLKMFSQHFVKKAAPLSKNSDMECVYFYKNLTCDNIQLMKKLLNNNKTLLHFKEIIIAEPGKCEDSSKHSSAGSLSDIASVSGSDEVLSDTGSVSGSDEVLSDTGSVGDTGSVSPTGKGPAKDSSTDSVSIISMQSTDSMLEDIARRLHKIAEQIESHGRL